MRNRGLRNLLSILLSLVLTVTAVGLLSLLSSGHAHAQDAAAVTIREDETPRAASVSATVPQKRLPLGRSMLAFLFILLFPILGAVRWRQAKRREKARARRAGGAIRAAYRRG